MSTDHLTPADVHSTVLAGIDHQIAAAELAPAGPWHIGNAVDPTRPVAVWTFPDLRLVADQVEWLAGEHIVAQHPQRAHAVLIGRRRILERHAPTQITAVVASRGKSMPGTVMDPAEPTRPATICNACRPARSLDVIAYRWPCTDYRDAAADLFPLETS